MTETICDHHYTVVLVWTLLVWHEYNVLLGVNNADPVLFEQFEETTHEPASTVGWVDAWHFANDHHIV